MAWNDSGEMRATGELDAWGRGAICGKASWARAALRGGLLGGRPVPLAALSVSGTLGVICGWERDVSVRVPRVAYFPDSFHEVNGVAHTSRNFLAYAQRHGLPFLCVRARGRGRCAFEQAGELRTLELRRSRALGADGEGP